MKLPEPGARPGVWANSAADLPAAELPLAPVRWFFGAVAIMVEVELRKLRHDPTEMIARVAQPVLWLLVFGPVFTRLRVIPTGNLPYLDFMTPGILAQSVLIIGIFYGVNVVWEREMGTVHRYLVSPASRTALVLGRGLGAGLRSVPLVTVVYLLALALGVRLSHNPLDLLAACALLVVSGTLFATQSLITACIFRTRERLMGLGQMVVMPMFFASNAIYPIEIMPVWLQVLARVNPLTYTVDGLRGVMLAQSTAIIGYGFDLAVLAGLTVILVIIGGWLFPRLAQ